MPIYEYVCDECGYEFERMQSFNSEPVRSCPQCSGCVRRVISPVGVIFKGSGWYITDSKRQLSATATRKSRQLADTSSSEKAEGAAEPSKPKSGSDGGSSAGDAPDRSVSSAAGDSEKPKKAKNGGSGGGDGSGGSGGSSKN